MNSLIQDLEQYQDGIGLVEMICNDLKVACQRINKKNLTLIIIDVIISVLLARRKKKALPNCFSIKDFIYSYVMCMAVLPAFISVYPMHV